MGAISLAGAWVSGFKDRFRATGFNLPGLNGPLGQHVEGCTLKGVGPVLKFHLQRGPEPGAKLSESLWNRRIVDR